VAVVVAVAAAGLAPGAAAQPADTQPADTQPAVQAVQAADGFGDVTGGVHKPAIDALAELGVFDGTECAEGMFCPGDEMRRWTMAVWLVRVLDEAEPPAATESSFADVDAGSRWLAHIERLAELEVTTGCLVDPLRFCPDRSVNRAEMATFLTRALDLEAADPAGFADTAGNFHEANIDALAAARITVGCRSDPPRYCPDQPVTRAEMATFLARALGLAEIPAPADPTEGEPTAAVEATDIDPTEGEPTAADPTTTRTPADPAACRPRGTQYTTAGFPLPEVAAPSIGTMRVAVLFLDFPDVQATYTTRDEAVLGLPYAEEYLETASYGRIDVEFVPLHGWLRAELSFGDYLQEFAIGESRVTPSAEAIRLADPSFDFTGIHAVMTVLPSSRFQAGNHTIGLVHTDEKAIRLMAEVNTSVLDEPRDPAPWGPVAAHELVHSLGLSDLYPYDATRRELPDAPPDRIWVRSEFGLMGLNTFFETHPDDSRIEITGRDPFGRQVTGHTFQLEAAEMLAWSRWQLGWLDESQVLCLTADRSRVMLSPVADPGDAAVMAAVPLSDTEVLVVEARVKVGYDAEQEEPHDDGALITVPALATEGALVYTVDASLDSGQLPLNIAGDAGNGQVDDYPILARGDQVVVRGYRITLVSDRGGAYIVAIFKTAD
jgi:hypothetical protein